MIRINKPSSRHQPSNQYPRCGAVGARCHYSIVVLVVVRICVALRTEYCGVETRKVRKRVVEREDLGRAYKRKVTRKKIC
jgi:hypothetical protein